jgi:hypothetical protein
MVLMAHCDTDAAERLIDEADALERPVGNAVCALLLHVRGADEDAAGTNERETKVV